MLVDMMPTLREGYILMGAVFGCLFALCIFLSGFFTRERADMKPLERDGHMLRDMFRTLTVKTFRLYLLLQVLKCVCMSIMSLIVPYYCKYYTGRESDQYLILGIIFLAQLCALPLYNRLAGVSPRPESSPSAPWAGFSPACSSFWSSPTPPPPFSVPAPSPWASPCAA